MNKKISVSAINVFAECPKKFMFQYTLRKFRPSNEHFIFGTFGHKINQFIGQGLDDDVIYAYIEQELESSSLQEALSKLKITDLKNLVDDYIEIIRDFLSNYIIIDTEIRLEDKDNVGVIDVIAVDEKNNELLILDYKFSKNFKDEEYVMDELQLYMYAKLMGTMPNLKSILKKYNIKKVYLGYFSMSKTGTAMPRVLKNGKLSKANDKSVTYDTFLEAIEVNNLKKVDYLEHLHKLKDQTEEKFKFTKLKLTNSEFNEKLKEIKSWNGIINHAIKNNYFPGRNSWTCSSCDIKSHCKNNIGGK